MNRKLVYLLLFFILPLHSCSNILDIWFTSEKEPEFKIETTAISNNTLRITIPGTNWSSGGRTPDIEKEYEEDEDGNETSTVKSASITDYTYDWGYYIYVSENPYKDHQMIGFVARSNVDLTASSSPDILAGLKQQTLGNSVELSSHLGSNQYLEYQCSADDVSQKKVYYFRAAYAFKGWNCSSDCTCSDTSCSVPCNCSGYWDDTEIKTVSAWASAQCGL